MSGTPSDFGVYGWPRVMCALLKHDVTLQSDAKAAAKAKQEEKKEDDEDDEDDEEQGETLCGICGGLYTASEFWIGCDHCNKW